MCAALAFLHEIACLAGPSQSLKVRGARSTVVGIICPLGNIGLTVRPKTWGGGPSPPIATALLGHRGRSSLHFQNSVNI